MAVAQAIEARAVEMKTAEQFDPAGTGIGQGALDFRHLKQREGGAAPVEPFADQRDRPFEPGKNLGIEPADFIGSGGSRGGQAIDLALPPVPRRGDIDLRRQLFGLGALDIAPVGVVNTERDRNPENHRNIVIGREVTKPGAQGNILDAVGPLKTDTRGRRLTRRRQKRKIRRIIAARLRCREPGEPGLIQPEIPVPAPIGGERRAGRPRAPGCLFAVDLRLRERCKDALMHELRIERPRGAAPKLAFQLLDRRETVVRKRRRGLRCKGFDPGGLHVGGQIEKTGDPSPFRQRQFRPGDIRSGLSFAATLPQLLVIERGRRLVETRIIARSAEILHFDTENRIGPRAGLVEMGLGSPDTCGTGSRRRVEVDRPCENIGQGQRLRLCVNVGRREQGEKGDTERQRKPAERQTARIADEWHDMISQAGVNWSASGDAGGQTLAESCLGGRSGPWTGIPERARSGATASLSAFRSMHMPALAQRGKFGCPSP